MTEPKEPLSVSQRLIALWQLPPEAIREGWRETTHPKPPEPEAKIPPKV